MYERHGHVRNRKRSSTHHTWTNMIARCTNPRRPDYLYYGGRGITVCARWRESFSAFLNDMGEKPTGTSLDRIDNARGYEPDNCRWATKYQQMQNTRGTRLITFNGEKMGLSAWARKLGIHVASIQGRLKRGWPIERALSTPARTQKPYKKLFIHGRRISLELAAAECGLKYSTVRGRLHRGWSLDQALTTGVGQ